jgi:hypothetical protein
MLRDGEVANVKSNESSASAKQAKNAKEGTYSTDELAESMVRLEAANVSIAIVVTEIDAGMVISEQRVVCGEVALRRAWESGAIVFSPREMFDYVRIAAAERRRIFREIKMLRGTA